MDTNGDGLTISLISRDSLNVDDVLLAIALSDLSLSISEVASDNHDLIILSDRERSDIILLAELLRKRSRHSNASLMRGGIEVCLSLLSRLRADVRVQLHLFNN